MSQEFDRQALVSIFTAEASDNLNKLVAAFGRADSSVSPYPPDHQLQQLFIVSHSLKGAAAMYGFDVASGLAGLLEKALEQVDEHNWESMTFWARDIIGRLRKQVEHIQQQGTEIADLLDGVPGTYPEGDSPLQEGGALSEAPAKRQATAIDDATDEQGVDVAQRADQGGDQYFIPPMDEEVFGYFLPEAQEYLETITSAVLELEKDPEEVGEVQRLFRAVHTLKGSAYTVGCNSIGDLTHELEDLVDLVVDGQLKITLSLGDQIFRSLDVVRSLLRRDVTQVADIKRQFNEVLEQLRSARSGEIAEVAAPSPRPNVVGIPAADVPLHREEPQPVPVAPGRSPRRSSRTVASKPVEQEGAAVIRVRRDRLERLLNLVGELVISRSRLEKRMLMLAQLSREVMIYENKMLNAVRAFEQKHAFSSSEPAATGKLEMPSSSVLSDFGSLEFDKYDDFNILSRSMGEVSADIAESMAQLSTIINQGREDMDHLQRLTLSLRNEIAQTRMVPLSTLFTRFQMAVREMGRTTGKAVNLDVVGGEIELDTEMVQRLLDPMIHIVRNSVYHGIETVEVREAAGKPATGTVTLQAFHRGTAVVIEIKDDGAGINLDKIKAKAVEIGLLQPAEAAVLSDEDTRDLIYLPGFSTAAAVGDQAGRGVGMDVVKQTVESMNGHISISSEPGVGTTFSLRMPFSLMISSALIVRMGQECYALPLPAIREVMATATHVVMQPDGHLVMQLPDETIEIRSLSQMLGDEAEIPASAVRPVVIFQSGLKVLGVCVDELLGRQEIVIKPLGMLKVFKKSFYSGAVIDSDGRVILVLDVDRLLNDRKRQPLAVRRVMPRTKVPVVEPLSKETAEAAGVQSGPSILLIDDSLSVRKFIGRMLEDAGYRVETAVDGEEGLKKATSASYDLIITDLEMPKMNGYEVIQALRESPQTEAVPIIVMTTRAGEKHRHVAMSLGATAYIAKPIQEKVLIEQAGQLIHGGAGAPVSKS